jgi:hypothetical protein
LSLKRLPDLPLEWSKPHQFLGCRLNVGLT